MSDRVVAFSVDGTPAPQGSKTVAKSKGGASHMREDNPNTEPWRNAVAARARVAMDGRPPLAVPARLEVMFSFARPVSHYRTGKYAGQLKPNAPIYCATRPDLDKLLRAIGDAMTGIVLQDDARIVEVAAGKVYGPPGVHITVLGLY